MHKWIDSLNIVPSTSKKKILLNFFLIILKQNDFFQNQLFEKLFNRDVVDVNWVDGRWNVAALGKSIGELRIGQMGGHVLVDSGRGVERAFPKSAMTPWVRLTACRHLSVKSLTTFLLFSHCAPFAISHYNTNYPQNSRHT